MILDYGDTFTNSYFLVRCDKCGLEKRYDKRRHDWRTVTHALQKSGWKLVAHFKYQWTHYCKECSCIG